MLLLMMIVSILFILLYFRSRSLFNLTDPLELYEIENFLTPEQCSELIQWARKNTMSPSYIKLNGKIKIDTDFRGSVSTQMGQTDWPLWYKQKLVSYITHEPLTIAMYTTGTRYKPHYDSSDLNGAVVLQRPWTILIYLNDDFEGGNTTFVNVNKKIIPKTGKAILFKNLDNNNRTIRNSMHQSDIVAKGEKWILNQWLISI